MIVFTPIPPESFVPYLGQRGGLYNTRRIYVFNLLSYDIRFPKVSKLIPQAELMSDFAYMNDDSQQFEQEYFEYLDTQEPPFLDMMQILTKEYIDGLSLIIVQTSINNPFCDSIVASLIKYFYTRYGIRAVTIQDGIDLEDLKESNSIFSPAGLTIIDHDIVVINAICPNIVQAPVGLFYAIEPLVQPVIDDTDYS